MTTVLLLGGHTIQALPVMKSLRQSAYKVICECEAKHSYGYWSRYSNEKIIRPLYHYKSKEYLDFILGLISEYKVDIILPLFDLSAEFVSINKDILAKRVSFVSPSYDVFTLGYSKNFLMGLCKDHSIPHPLTSKISLDYVEESSSYTGFPALIKPDITTGGRGMKIVKNSGEVISYLPDILRTYGSSTLQEFIPPGGRQFKAHHFRTKSGEYLASVVVEKLRFYPENGGSSCCNCTIKHSGIIESTRKVLDILGWEGFADFDLIEDPRDGVIKIMEINPRFPASIKSAFMAGVDFVKIYVDYCNGVINRLPTYDLDVCTRFFGLDLLWFLNSKDRFKTRPSWFKLLGKNISYQDGDVNDPMPFFFGTYSGLKKIMNSKFRKSKSGLR